MNPSEKPKFPPLKINVETPEGTTKNITNNPNEEITNKTTQAGKDNIPTSPPPISPARPQTLTSSEAESSSGPSTRSRRSSLSDSVREFTGKITNAVLSLSPTFRPNRRSSPSPSGTFTQEDAKASLELLEANQAEIYHLLLKDDARPGKVVVEEFAESLKAFADEVHKGSTMAVFHFKGEEVWVDQAEIGFVMEICHSLSKAPHAAWKESIEKEIDICKTRRKFQDFSSASDTIASSFKNFTAKIQPTISIEENPEMVADRFIADLRNFFSSRKEGENTLTIAGHTVTLDEKDLRVCEHLDHYFSGCPEKEYYRSVLIDYFASKQAEDKKEVHIQKPLADAITGVSNQEDADRVAAYLLGMGKIVDSSSNIPHIDLKNLHQLLKDPRIACSPLLTNGILTAARKLQITAIREQQYEIVCEMDLNEGFVADWKAKSLSFDKVDSHGKQHQYLDVEGILHIAASVLNDIARNTKSLPHLPQAAKSQPAEQTYRSCMIKLKDALFDQKSKFDFFASQTEEIANLKEMIENLQAFEKFCAERK